MEDNRRRWPFWVGIVLGAIVLFAAGGVAGVFLDRALIPAPMVSSVQYENNAARVPRGVVVVEVEADSPAASAGIAVDDEIQAIDGQGVDSSQALVNAIASHKPGDQVTLSILRNAGNQSLEIGVTLGQDPQDSSRAYLGVRIADRVPPQPGAILPFGQGRFSFRGPNSATPPQNRNRQGGNQGFLSACPNGSGPMANARGYCGLLVSAVADGSPAQSAGIRVGDLILDLNGQSIESISGFVDDIGGMKPGASVRLTLYRAGQTQPFDLTITLESNPDSSGKAYLGVTVPGFRSSSQRTPGYPFNGGPFPQPFPRSSS
jgi:membrane-associated protease RseP (regulator of RpoE activity)